MASSYEDTIVATISNSSIAPDAQIAATKLADDEFEYIVGNLYTWEGFSGALTPLTVTANRLYSHKFKPRETHTFVKIGVRVTTSIDLAKVRVGIYNDSAGSPGTLLIDAGEVTLSGVGAQNVDVVLNTVITKGEQYHLVCVSDSAIAISSCATTSLTAYNGATSYADTRDLTGVYSTHIYAALPATFGAITQTNGSVPVIRLTA